MATTMSRSPSRSKSPNASPRPTFGVPKSSPIAAQFVRRFGTFSAGTVREENEIEAVAVDDELGYVYYADEADGIHKWHADPDHPDAARELAHFGRTGFRGDREEIAIYSLPDGTGYIICTDQLDDDSEYHIYPREGAPGNPHDHSREIAVVRGGADATDGLEISSASYVVTEGKGITSDRPLAMSRLGLSSLHADVLR